MPKTLTKEDLKLIGQVVESKIAPVEKRVASIEAKIGSVEKRFVSVETKIDSAEERLTESIRGINSNFNQGLSQLRKDTEELMSEHHQSLIDAITEVLLKDKLQAFETDLQQVKDRLTMLEAVQ